MFTRFSILAIVIVCLEIGAARAQSPASNNSDGKRPLLHDHNVILPGLLTQRMLDGMIGQAVGDLADRYEWDADQSEQIRARMRRRATEFLTRRSDDISDVILAFMEVRLATDAPSEQYVAEWSGRAADLMGELRTEIGAGVEDTGDVLTEEQFSRLSTDALALDAGLAFMDSKLHGWASGGFNPSQDWEQLRPGEAAKPLVAQGGVASAAGGGTNVVPIGHKATVVTSQPVALDDEWAAYTERFIQRYQLDDAQTQRARLFLKSAQNQRVARTTQLAAVEVARKAVADAQAGPEKAGAEHELEKQLAPFERIFSRLKEKLESLPTRSQRTAAAAADRASEAGSRTTKQGP